MAPASSRAKRVTWGLVGLLGALLLVIAAWLVVPILTNSPQGQSGQPLEVEGFPTSVSAVGDDGRERTLSVELESSNRGLDQLQAGDRLTVSAAGYDAGSGVYVALCKVPDELGVKPGPCLGGVGAMEEQDAVVADVVEYAPSNWINDDWAWRLFGSRSFDDRDAGTFTAFIEVPPAVDENVDCREVSCGLYTRNDHTALDDRVQDLYVPIAFGE